jgi:phosphate butyryltransferase
MQRLSELVELAKKKHSGRLAVAGGHDPDTIQATARAVREGLVEVILVADESKVAKLLEREGLERDLFTVVHKPDPSDAARAAVSMVAKGEAEMLMKGLVGTDVYMRMILDKEKGILPTGGVLSHVSVLEIPAYHKLLIVADVAVIPCPDLSQKTKILGYCVQTAHCLGVELPKVAIIAATEKVSPHRPATLDAALLAKMAERGQVKGAEVDGPLALDLAVSKHACEIKGIRSKVAGDADILIFPNIESGNVFYKALNVLGGAKTAAVVAGTKVPCVLTSRADDDETKFFSIALAAMLANVG